MKGWRFGGWMGGDVSVMALCQTLFQCQCQSHQLIPQWSATVQCVSKPLCLLPLQSVCWCFCVVPLLSFLSDILSLTIRFGDDAVAEQPSHPCLVIHNTMSHVTPCFLLSLCLANNVLKRIRIEKGLWRNGNASDYGSEDSRFDPWQARIFLFYSTFFLFSFSDLTSL